MSKYLSYPEPIGTEQVSPPRRSLREKQESHGDRHYLALLCGILCLSLSSLFIRWADAPGMVTSFYRMAIAALILSPFFLGSRARRIHQKRCAQIEPASGTKWLWLPLLAGLFTAADHAVWSTATQLTTVANATLLNNLAPLWVALFAWIAWKQRLNGSFWLGLLLACGGVFGVCGEFQSGSAWLHNLSLGRGDMLALVSSLFYSGYYLVTQRARQRLDTLTFIWPVVCTAALVLLGANLAFHHLLTGYSAATYATFVGAALISQVIGYFSVGYALGHLPASVVAPTMIAQPALTALLAIPLAGENLHPWQIAGGASVLAGIFLVVRSQK